MLVAPLAQTFWSVLAQVKEAQGAAFLSPAVAAHPVKVDALRSRLRLQTYQEAQAPFLVAVEMQVTAAAAL